MSLSNTLTLDEIVYDRLNDSTGTGKSRSLYVNKAAHVSIAAPYSVEFLTTDPKTNGDSLGVLRPETRIRVTVTVNNAAGVPVQKILGYTLTGTVPVGYDPTIEAKAREILASWISHAEYPDFVRFGEV